MKVFFFFLSMLLSSVVFAQSTDDAKTLEKMNEDWIHAYPGKDTATLSRIFADDLIMITPNGTRMSRKDILTNLASQRQEIISARVAKVQVRLIGDVGLVMAEAVFVTKDNGKEVPGRTNYLDVYEKRNGRWYAVAAHVTFLGQ